MLGGLAYSAQRSSSREQAARHDRAASTRGLLRTTGFCVPGDSQSDRSVGLSLSLRACVFAVKDEAEKRLEGFAHRPDVRILSRAVGMSDAASDRDGVAGAVRDGRIYLFCNPLGVGHTLQKSLFHELLPDDLRQFLPKPQFIAQRTSLLHFQPQAGNPLARIAVRMAIGSRTPCTSYSSSCP